MDGRVPPWMRDIGRMVEDPRRVDRSDQPVLNDDIGQREHERQPCLVERQEGEDDEELEVRLNRTAGQMHQHRGPDDETDGRARRPDVAAPSRRHRDEAGQGDWGDRHPCVGRRMALDQCEHAERWDMCPQQPGKPSVAPLPDLLGQPPSFGQEPRSA